MTDSEKLLVIVDTCHQLRRSAVEDGRKEAIEGGWNAQLSTHHVKFDTAGTILEIAGHPDSLNWARDALGATGRHTGTVRTGPIGGDMPS